MSRIIPICLATLAVTALAAGRAPAAGEADKAAVIARIKELGGSYQVDEKAPGKPIVRIDLGRTALTNEGLAFLSDLTTLKSLDLSFSRITTLRALSGLDNLESLTLMFTQITDEGLVSISDFKNLKHLDLSCSAKFTNNGLSHLRGLNRLEKLVLSATNVTDAGLNYLTKQALPALTHLDLNSARITDAAVPIFQEMPRLRILILRATLVSNNGIDALKKLTFLSTLDLTGSKVTWEAVAPLQQALPKTRIFRTGPQDSTG